MKKKILAIFLATLVIVSFAVVGASAALINGEQRVDEAVNPSAPKVVDLVRFAKAWAEIYNITASPTAQLTFVALRYEYVPNYSEGIRGAYNFIYQVGDTNMSFAGSIEEWGQKFPTGEGSQYLPLTTTCKYTSKRVIVDEDTGVIGINTQNFGTTTDNRFLIGVGGNKGGYFVLLYVEPGHAVAGGLNNIYTDYKGTNFSTPIRDTITRYVETVNTWLNGSAGDAGDGFTQEDIDNAYDDGYLDGVQIGFNDGVEDGYAIGYPEGYDKGHEDGYDKGYDKGYDVGFSKGPVEIDIGEIISSVPEGAKSIIDGAFGFEVFGINVAGTLTALLVVAIVAYVVRKLMSR